MQLVGMRVPQTEVMAQQRQKLGERGEYHLISHERGRTGPWRGRHSVRQGWEGGLGTDWGHVFPPWAWRVRATGKKYRVRLALRSVIYVLSLAWPPGLLLRGEWGAQPAPLDSSVGHGAHCKVTLWRIKLLVMPRVAQIKVKYHIQSSRGVFAIKLSLENK